MIKELFFVVVVVVFVVVRLVFRKFLISVILV